MVDRCPRCQSDGEPNVVPGQDSEDAHEREQYEHDDHRREVDHPRRRQPATNGTEDWLGRLDHEQGRLRLTSRVDIGKEHAREDQEEEGEQQDLQKVPEEQVHEPESSSLIRPAPASVPVVAVVAAVVVVVRSFAE